MTRHWCNLANSCSSQTRIIIIMRVGPHHQQHLPDTFSLLMYIFSSMLVYRTTTKIFLFLYPLSSVFKNPYTIQVVRKSPKLQELCFGTGWLWPLTYDLDFELIWDIAKVTPVPIFGRLRQMVQRTQANTLEDRVPAEHTIGYDYETKECGSAFIKFMLEHTCKHDLEGNGLPNRA